MERKAARRARSPLHPRTKRRFPSPVTCGAWRFGPLRCSKTEVVLEIRVSLISKTVHKIARELTGQRRNRLFAYDGYLATLEEGIEIPDRTR